jgi:curved DNA-binding protein CbpA
MTDHYELLGVDPAASKDEIKAAYRAEVADADSSRRAQLNRAWNVLSDPIQRERYDESLAASGDGEPATTSDGSDVTVVVPSRRTTGARRGDDTTAIVTNGNGSSNNGSSKNGKAAAAADPNAKPLPAHKQPTILPPEGMTLASTRSRSYALAIDFAALVIIFVVIQLAGAAIIKNQYPDQVNRRDDLTDQVKKLDKQKDTANDRVDNANKALDNAKKKANGDTQSAQDDVTAAKANLKKITKQDKDTNDALVKENNKLQPLSLLVSGVALLLALLYCVPMSARTGQTFGKRLRKIRLVRVDGSPPGLSTSLIHYGIPIVLAIVLFGVLGPIAVILALGSTLWNIRDKNHQGVNDKLGKTFVVEA